MKNFRKRLVVYWKNIGIIQDAAHNAVNQYRSSMKRGVWHLRFAEKPMVIRHTKESKSFIHKNAQKLVDLSGGNARIKIIIKDILLRCSWHYWVKDEPDNGFRSDCIMLSTNGGVYLYDFEEGKVEKYHTQKRINEGYYRLKQAGYWEVFASPVLQIRGNAVLEKLVRSTNDGISDRECYIYVLKGYTRYFQMAAPIFSKRLGDMVAPFRQIIPSCEIFFQEELSAIQIKHYILHGDMLKTNIMYTDKEELTVLDYARVNELPFFYDLLLWPCMDIWFKSDWELWLELRDGRTEVGRLFTEILKAQGIDPSNGIKNVLLMLMPFVYNAVTQQDERMALDWNPEKEFRNKLGKIMTGLLGDMQECAKM